MFLPRQVALKRPRGETSNAPKKTEPEAVLTVTREDETRKDGKDFKQLSDDECTVLLRLTLSEYTLRTEPLKLLLEGSSDGESIGCNVYLALIACSLIGYLIVISLSRLLDCSIYFQSLESNNRPSQPDIVRVLKAYFPHVEVRLKLSNPSNLYNHGYEVRSTSWSCSAGEGRSEKWWDDRTFYTVSLPTHAATSYLIAP